MPDSNDHNPPKHSVPTDPSGTPEAHDVLAAEEFGIGTRDDRFPADPAGVSPPHDILAAEEFGIGTRDDRFPADPAGKSPPHDILAAEVFAMPVADVDPSRPTGPAVRPVAIVALGLLVVGVLAVIFRHQ